MIFIWVYSQAFVIFFAFLPAQYLPIIQRGNMIQIAGSPTKNMMQGKAGIALRRGNFHCFQEWLYDVLTRRPIIFVFYLIWHWIMLLHPAHWYTLTSITYFGSYSDVLLHPPLFTSHFDLLGCCWQVFFIFPLWVLRYSSQMFLGWMNLHLIWYRH